MNLIVGVVLIFLRSTFTGGGLPFSLAFSIGCIYLGRKFTKRTIGKILFFIGLISLIINVLIMFVFKFFLMAILIIFFFFFFFCVPGSVSASQGTPVDELRSRARLIGSARTPPGCSGHAIARPAASPGWTGWTCARPARRSCPGTARLPGLRPAAAACGLRRLSAAARAAPQRGGGSCRLPSTPRPGRPAAAALQVPPGPRRRRPARPADGRCLRALPSRRPGPPTLVPVPLHRARLRRRGYDQALELARPLARRWRCRCASTCWSACAQPGPSPNWAPGHAGATWKGHSPCGASQPPARVRGAGG